MSRLALTPTNVPASATDITIPTLRTGDLYFNTTSGLMVYNGSAWVAVNLTAVTEIDGGAFDSIAPYNGGTPTTTVFANTFDGGTP